MWRPGTKTRIVLGLAALLATILAPWWVPVLCMLLLSFFWRAWEVALLGLTIDLLWSPTGSLPLFLIGALILVWALEPIRNEFLIQ